MNVNILGRPTVLRHDSLVRVTTIELHAVVTVSLNTKLQEARNGGWLTKWLAY